MYSQAAAPQFHQRRYHRHFSQSPDILMGKGVFIGVCIPKFGKCDCIRYLKLGDSAMGSGHFLINVAYHVSNYIVDILENNKWETDEINADVTYWRRKVVENCIYGIDINKNIPLFNMTKEQYMFPILKKYEHIKEIGSDTKADVALQHEAYEEILADIKLLNSI